MGRNRKTRRSKRTAGGSGPGWLADRRRAAHADAAALRYALGPVSLLTDLDAISTEHRGCGDLDGGVEPQRWKSHAVISGVR